MDKVFFILRHTLPPLIVFLFLTACAPPKDPIPLDVGQAPPTESRPTPTPVPGAPVLNDEMDEPEAESLAVSEIPATETPELSTATPKPTLTEWETVQQEVRRYRNRLENGSDGYNGLTTALDQPGPNSDWCDGLTTAINDFVYIDDVEAEEALGELQEAQGCD